MGIMDVINDVAARAGDLGSNHSDAARRRIFQLHDERDHEVRQWANKYESLRLRYNELVNTNAKKIDAYESLRLRFNALVRTDSKNVDDYNELVRTDSKNINDYNELVKKNDSLVDKYNEVVDRINEAGAYLSATVNRVLFLDQIAFSRAEEIHRFTKLNQCFLNYFQEKFDDETANELTAVIHRDLANLEAEFLATPESAKYGIPEKHDLTRSFDPITNKYMLNANKNGVLFDQIKLFGEPED